MNDYFNFSGFTGSISVIKKFGNFKVRQSNQGGVPPVLSDVFVEYSFIEAQKDVEVQGKSVSFKFPKVNEMLTEYCRKCLPAICTLAFIDLVNEEIPKSSAADLTAAQNSVPAIFPGSNGKLESVIGLYNRVYNQPKISAEAEQTLSYYFGGSTNWLGLPNLKSPESKISELKEYLKNLETIYTKRLINEVLPATATDLKGNPIGAGTLKWFNEKKGGKILDEEAAKFFIDRANEHMSADVKIEFAENRLRAIMFYADPIISDERFRMSLEDKRWHEYDETIKKEVAFYNQKFSGSKGFIALDWRWVKAMVWSEVMAGPKNDSKNWQNYPMQIGIVKGGVTDPGLPTLKARTNGTSLIISQEFSDMLKQKQQMDGTTNIKAGIAWLYYNAIRLNIKPAVTVFDEPNQQIYTYTMLPRETLADIANKKEIGTTIDVLMNENGLNETTAKGLLPGTVLKYKKAHKEVQIGKWENWKDAVLLYNGGGDTRYEGKFERALQIILSRSSK